MNRRGFVERAFSPFSGFTNAKDVTVGETPAERRRRRFANVLLRTHKGAAVRFYDDLLKDKTVLINFMYTNCADRCPLTTAKLAQVQRILGNRSGRDVFMYSISIDPEHDTPPALRQYARAFGAKPGWLFLTGEAHDIRSIRANFGDDPNLAFSGSNHLNLVAYGVEPLERWGGFPAWIEPESMVRYFSWIQPNGARPRL